MEEASAVGANIIISSGTAIAVKGAPIRISLRIDPPSGAGTTPRFAWREALSTRIITKMVNGCHQAPHPPASAAQQMRHEEIGERAGHDQAMGVLFEPAIAHVDETEHPLDDP